MNKGFVTLLVGLMLCFAQPLLALTHSQCVDLRKEINLTYLSYVDRQNELQSATELLSRKVIQQQKDRFLKEASQLSKVYSAICD
tara:strand:+ start:577 stop:831 length:255 start_codon:yes stop_codon:yes gene_type:complete